MKKIKNEKVPQTLAPQGFQSGGGALSSIREALRTCGVVKLFSQEVEHEKHPLYLWEREKFVNERSEFTNLGEGNTLSRIAKIRSRSLSNSTLSRGERKGAIPLSWERGRGEGNSLFAQQTEMNLPSYRPNVLTTSNNPSHKRVAFTLAEVLITLGIIGVVAAITMPTIMANVQKTILKNQFKSAYSKFSQAVFQTQARMGYPVECFYWTTGYKYATKCDQWNEYGSCRHWVTKDGSPLPSDTAGPKSGCPAFEEELFTKTLKVVKFCQDHALANGCLTDAYRGKDKVKKEENPDVEQDPNQIFSDSNIKNNYSSCVLSDGMVIIRYKRYGSAYSPIYAIDINGHKGPNKWGYDIFTLQLEGDNDGIKKIVGYDYVTEKGGIKSTDMVKNAFSE